MSFNDLLADLDATVFAELADDTAAVWTQAHGPAVLVAAMLDTGGRAASQRGMVSIESGQVVRLSAAEIAAKAPGKHPEGGDTISVNGRVLVVRGEPWLDQEMNGRDWLCLVNG